MSCKWTKDSGRLATCFLLLELVLVLYRADSSDSKVLLTSRWSEKWLRESQSLRGYSVLCTGKKSTEMSFRNLENRGSKSWEENSERKRFLAVRLPHRAESSAAAALAASLASKPALSLSTLLLCTIVFVVKKTSTTHGISQSKTPVLPLSCSSGILYRTIWPGIKAWPLSLDVSNRCAALCLWEIPAIQS